jgi:hypothetical protein
MGCATSCHGGDRKVREFGAGLAVTVPETKQAPAAQQQQDELAAAAEEVTVNADGKLPPSQPADPADEAGEGDGGRPPSIASNAASSPASRPASPAGPAAAGLLSLEKECMALEGLESDDEFQTLWSELAADGFVEGFPNPVIFAESFAKPVVPADGADGWSAPKNARAPTPQPSAWKDILAGLADSEAAVSQQRAAVDDDFAADFAKLWAEAEAEKLAPPVRRPTSTGFVGHLHHAQAPPSPPHPHGTAAPEPAALYQAAPAATAVHRGAMIPAVGGEGAVFAASVEAVLLSQAFASRRASARAVPPSSALADCHPQRVSTHNITRWGRADSPALV